MTNTVVGVTFSAIFNCCMNDKTLTANQNPIEFTGGHIENGRWPSREAVYRTLSFISVDAHIVTGIVMVIVMV